MIHKWHVKGWAIVILDESRLTALNDESKQQRRNWHLDFHLAHMDLG